MTDLIFTITITIFIIDFNAIVTCGYSGVGKREKRAMPPKHDLCELVAPNAGNNANFGNHTCPLFIILDYNES